MSTVYISFSGPINSITVQNLLGVSFNQIAQGATHLYYLFSTPGGQVQDGIAAYTAIKGMPVKTTMHNIGNVDSIGNAIFLAGNRRKACDHCTFMFHGVGFNVEANMRFEEKLLRERLDGILADQKRIGGIITKESALSPQQVNPLFRKAATKDAAYALSHGIIHAIEDVNIVAGSPVIQLVFNG